jgi:alanyl-tRNA synthetase
VVLDRTPFYAEGGGQVGDRGVLRSGDGTAVFEVDDAQKPVGGLIVHRGTLRGRLRVGETITAEVDAERRAHTMRNHTGTHVLHRALRNVVGERARQAGSLVTPDYLRFDFPFDRALTRDELDRIEDEARRIFREDRPVSIAFMPMSEAINGGADAFFDEKYGETVRTIRVRDYSFELCGGTHCGSTGQIGGFVITGERSIGSGMRRIEALTGAGADAFLRDRLRTLDRAAEVLDVPSPDVVPERVAVLQDELREARRRVRAGGAGATPRPGELASRAEVVAQDTRLVAYAGPFESIDAIKGVAKDIRAVLGTGVVALGLDADEPQVFVTVSDDLVARGVSAGDLVRAAVGAIDGKGGGRPEMAQGKGSRRDGLPDALAAIRAALGEAGGSPR